MNTLIALRTIGDRSFLIGGLKSAIFDLLGDLSKSDDLDSISISISILEKKRPVLMCRAYVLLLLLQNFTHVCRENYLGLVWDIFCSRVRVIPGTQLTRYHVLSTTGIYNSSTAVAAVNSSNIDNAVRLYRPLLYSIFHFHIISFGLGHASCMHSRTCIPAVI